MEFPPRGGSRAGGGDDLEIDFVPLQRDEPAPRPRAARRESRAARRPAATPRSRRRGRPRSETLARVFWVLPWIVFALAVIAVGGVLFAATMALFACVGLGEFFRMASDTHPFRPAGFAVGIGLVAAAYFGSQFQIVIVGAAAF